MILIPLEDFANLATTLICNHEIHTSFLSFRERCLKYSVKDDNPGMPSKNEILLFTYRLYLTNRLTWYYQYPDEAGEGIIQIKQVDEDDFQGKFLSYEEIVEILHLILYNCTTNGGRCLLNSEDYERVQRLLQICHSKMLQR